MWKTRTLRRKAQRRQGGLNVQPRWSWEFRGERPTMIPRLTENDAKSPFSSLLRRRLLRSEGSRPVPRNVYISKADLETYGYTSGCIGCRSILKGGSRQGHSVACRARVEDLLRGSDKFEKSQQRVNEFLEKAIIESEHKTKRRRLRAHRTNRCRCLV